MLVKEKGMDFIAGEEEADRCVRDYLGGPWCCYSEAGWRAERHVVC